MQPTPLSRPLFSVIVATYNRPLLLREALKSISAQTVNDFECIVVDDASHSAEPVMPNDQRFRLVSLETNLGLAAVWNLGVSEATGRYVAFLDDDDQWTSQRLKIASSHVGDADVIVCGGTSLGSPNLSGSGFWQGNVHETILDSFTPNMGRTAVRREQIVPFDTTYKASQDIDWWLRQSGEAVVTMDDRVGHLSRSHEGVRHGNGPSARIRSGHRLLEENAAYFADHAAARAFRQYRLSVMYLAAGEVGMARKFIGRSLMSRPSGRAVRALPKTLGRSIGIPPR